MYFCRTIKIDKISKDILVRRVSVFV